MTLEPKDITKIFQNLTENCWSCYNKHPDEFPAMRNGDNSCSLCDGRKLVLTDAGSELVGFLNTFFVMQPKGSK